MKCPFKSYQTQNSILQICNIKMDPLALETLKIKIKLWNQCDDQKPPNSTIKHLLNRPTFLSYIHGRQWIKYKSEKWAETCAPRLLVHLAFMELRLWSTWTLCSFKPHVNSSSLSRIVLYVSRLHVQYFCMDPFTAVPREITPRHPHWPCIQQHSALCY